MKPLIYFAAVAFACVATTSSWAEPANLKVLGNFTGNKKQVDLVERPFFDGLAKQAEITTRIAYSPMDLVNVKGADAMRLLKSGAFDIASVQIGLAARDDQPLPLTLADATENTRITRAITDAFRAGKAIDL